MQTTSTNTGLKMRTSWPIEKYLIKALHKSLAKPRIAFKLWDGYRAGDSCSTAPCVHINNRRVLWQLVQNPDMGFGEGYSTGDIDIDGDLVEMLEEYYQASNKSGEQRFLEWLINKQKHSPLKFNINPHKAKNNAQHHYDLSNDFYRLWLDDEMVYTCAYYSRDYMTLEQAQFAKMEHICKKLQLKPGDTVIEAGCGWGGLSRHMARHYGVKVQAYNVSTAQLEEANKRCIAEGLDDRITYIEDDYRNICGTADVFVSIGMLEHVGPNHYGSLGEVIDRCLKDDGRGLIHTIGQNQSNPANPWLQKYIFPEGHPPTLREMMDIFEPYDFAIRDLENIGPHYALTLQHWLNHFENHKEKVKEMFDDFFVRMWRLYLSGSIANFTTGQLQLYQVLFNRAANQDLPLTREYMY
jgi:cyclopropane-fatty-acyl-phospholipid synthase